MYQYLYILLFFSFCLSPLFAQDTTRVFGTIRDAKTGEALPFSKIYNPYNSSVATSSDFDGTYRLKTATALDSLRFSSIGYEEKTYSIERGKKQQLDILLQARSERLDMVVVVPEKRRRRRREPRDSAAYRLWREVVKNKDIHEKPQAQLLSYRDYTKAEFDWMYVSFIRSSGFMRKHLPFVAPNVRGGEDGSAAYLPSLLKETITDVYMRKEPKEQERKIVRADRFSGVENESVSDFLGGQLEEVNPYKNSIFVLGKSFASPFARAATISYKFYLRDSVLKNGNMSYKLDFVPHSTFDLAFIGSAWIDGESYAIQSIKFELPGSVNLNYISRYVIEQHYIPIRDSSGQQHWLKDNEKIYALFSRKKGLEKAHAFALALRKESQRSQIVWNGHIDDSIFSKKPVSFDDAALERDEDYWTANRSEPLTQEQDDIYPMVDSVKQSRLFKLVYGIGYTLGSAHAPVGKFEIGRVLQLVSWNEVEGIRFKLAARTSRKFSRNLNLNAYIAYGTEDKLVKGGGGFSWFIPNPDRQWRQIWGSWTYDYVQPGQLNRALNYDNIIVSAFRSQPLSNLLKKQNRSLSYGHEWTKGLSNSITFSQEIYYALPNSGFEFSNGQVSIDRFSTAEVKLNTHWGPGEFFFRNANNRTTLGGKLPIFDLDYTFQTLQNILGQNYQNHRIDFRVRQRLNWYMGYTRYTLRASQTIGPVPYPVMTVHLGNQSYIHNRHAFNLMNEFEFVSDRFVSLLMDHHFDGFFLNKIPLIRRLKLREIAILRGLYGSLDPSNAALMDLPAGIGEAGLYIETGFGIENIFNIFRVDILWRLTQRDQATTQPWGIRVSFSPKF